MRPLWLWPPVRSVCQVRNVQTKRRAADQFDDFDTPVFVGKRSLWHRSFQRMTYHVHAEFTNIASEHLAEYELLRRNIDAARQR